jgi:hypothetical protein
VLTVVGHGASYENAVDVAIPGRVAHTLRRDAVSKGHRSKGADRSLT